jgi:hypothetical protein
MRFGRFRLARALDAWTDELLAYFTSDGLSNVPSRLSTY